MAGPTHTSCSQGGGCVWGGYFSSPSHSAGRGSKGASWEGNNQHLLVPALVPDGSEAFPGIPIIYRAPLPHNHTAPCPLPQQLSQGEPLIILTLSWLNKGAAQARGTGAPSRLAPHPTRHYGADLARPPVDPAPTRPVECLQGWEMALGPRLKLGRGRVNHSQPGTIAIEQLGDLIMSGDCQ
ncbi:arf-GAP with coiled-coil, ANK repeat and PH domain-containing protein 1 [Platysternon megacephalum]|uniref:Arf-GAP with coiled-coil, ANK repeat and PH domain-containing protein 1 n=1 Tax=Platysternon megacephalum TaxID=55544 RepID=A0A4D9DKW7_9SAUR|nr:arf-GAP with coiled-coil, ANK repeat and PH domain-containing protein 1 [Platysternon megacephalum]